jgi:preprotein translocase subunit YajC
MEKREELPHKEYLFSLIFYLLSYFFTRYFRMSSAQAKRMMAPLTR